MVFSSIKHSIPARLLGGLTLVLFLSWFVLPCCHCQWDAIFGNSQSQTAPTGLSFDLENSDGQPCHCDEHSPKAFEMANESDQLFGFQTSSPVAGSNFLHLGPDDRPNDALTRGPPSRKLHLHQSRQRVYLRHRSLLL